MKRPIKFRACDAYGKIYFGSFDESDCTMSCWNLEDGGIVAVERDTVAQLVGFDKNGREVYEGDELDWRNGGGTIRIPQIYAKQYYYPLKEATL